MKRQEWNIWKLIKSLHAAFQENQKATRRFDEAVSRDNALRREMEKMQQRLEGR